MNNSLNEYLRFNFELNIELNHFLARFNVKMNNQNVSPTPNDRLICAPQQRRPYICIGYFPCFQSSDSAG